MREGATRVSDVSSGRACPWMSALLKAPDDNAFAGVRITLQKDKLDLMNMAGANVHNPKALQKEDEKYRVLKVKFLQSCEKVKFRKTRLEARTAFITFDSEEAFERIKKVYIDDATSTWKKYCCGQPIDLQLDGVFPLKLVEAERPSDYVREAVE